MTKKKSKILPRRSMPMQDPAARVGNFNEVANGYSLELAQEEARRCLQCKTPTCQDGCPVEVDCKRFIRELAEGQVEQAFRTIKETNSLPAVCGRVCPQENQCEGRCKLRPTGQPVAIGRLERYVADAFYAGTACEATVGREDCPMIREDLRVAAIGSGPASLTLAGYLAAQGVKVEVFEALHLPGGVLSYGIPEFRLPKSIVRTEVETLKEQGVEFHMNWVGGKTMTVGDLFDQGFKAVFLGLGAGLPRFMKLPGENLIGVFSANEYLTRVNLMGGYRFPDYDTPVFPGRKVTVIGGGNVAMDAARTALRLGAEEVRIVYRRTQEEMPARLEELEHALEEGVQLEILACPVAFQGDEGGRLTSMRVQKMCLGEPDESGRCRPMPVEDEAYDLETDLAIIAVGSGPNQILLNATPNLGLNSRGYIEVDQETLETNMPMVFAGGDIVTGAATVVEAMGAGRQAGKEISRRLLKQG
ncbi:NADPH-dependent glutamate synthase [Desulfohalobium retbaense]|uniref:Glutamate synthase (NADPH), homotetrameric n=1 Tax=Desulfohalobium retbaense (strain ATCC 49708 / DSM 5692 / JCM 16813 / HR100) TaxID=485915 RepID=C8WZZ0_DESRD|nr:glutamate synthase (NADPH), homotetrameric [Desulfohalobium retbaense DSM 5692]